MGEIREKIWFFGSKKNMLNFLYVILIGQSGAVEDELERSPRFDIPKPESDCEEKGVNLQVHCVG